MSTVSETSDGVSEIQLDESNLSTPKPGYREIPDQDRPKNNSQKKTEFQEHVLELVESQNQPVEEEADFVDLSLQAVAKCMKRQLNESDREDLIDEILELVARFIKSRHNQPSQVVQMSTQMSTPPQQQQHLPPMPPQQNMQQQQQEDHFDPASSQTYYNM